jgi:hypothetical protein
VFRKFDGFSQGIIAKGVLLDLKHVLASMHLVKEIFCIKFEACQPPVLVRVHNIHRFDGLVNEGLISKLL